MERIFLIENGFGRIVFASESESARDRYFENIDRGEKWNGKPWYSKTKKDVNLSKIVSSVANKIDALEIYAIRARG